MSELVFVAAHKTHTLLNSWHFLLLAWRQLLPLSPFMYDQGLCWYLYIINCFKMYYNLLQIISIELINVLSRYLGSF